MAQERWRKFPSGILKVGYNWENELEGAALSGPPVTIDVINSEDLTLTYETTVGTTTTFVLTGGTYDDENVRVFIEIMTDQGERLGVSIPITILVP